MSSLSNREVLRRLELTVTRRLDGLLQGDHRGLVPGHGSELGEAREYQPGDDVRRIDWNVTARMQTTHVRETIADRELELWMLIDQSASLDFGTANHEKRDLALEAAGAVGFLTARSGNRLGGMLLRPGGRNVIVPARSGRTHLQALLARVMDAPRIDGAGPTDLGAGMYQLAAGMRRRGLAVVISDFLDGDSLTGPFGWESALRRLAVRHDVLAVEVIDPRELELPPVGVLQVVDAETGALREVQTADPRLRARYAAAAASQRAAIDTAIQGSGADHLVLRTDRDWLLDLARFVLLRRKRFESVPPRAGR
ncbi:MAG: hypothetical protein QOF97_1070 [Acidimicrobiaceae bacterium]|jgi:uncharacterized protein (DUF58 family)